MQFLGFSTIDVSICGRGRGREGQDDRPALSHRPSLPAARLRAPARGRHALAWRRAAPSDPALGRQRQGLHDRLPNLSTFAFTATPKPKTLEFRSTLRWSLEEDRQHDKGVTRAALETIAALLNTEGGDVLIGVADDGSTVGIERTRPESDDGWPGALRAGVPRAGSPRERSPRQ